MKYYSYAGTVSEISSNRLEPIILGDIVDDQKAPIMLKCYNAGLHKYLTDRSWTDAEERYIKQIFVYDDILQLVAIIIPTDGYVPAKVIANANPSGIWTDEIEIFGEQELIETAEPKPMSRDEAMRWGDFKCKHSIYPNR